MIEGETEASGVRIADTEIACHNDQVEERCQTGPGLDRPQPPQENPLTEAIVSSTKGHINKLQFITICDKYGSTAKEERPARRVELYVHCRSTRRRRQGGPAEPASHPLRLVSWRKTCSRDGSGRNCEIATVVSRSSTFGGQWIANR
jgi:hypothetical protein